MKVKKVKCPMCHGEPNMTNDMNLDCGLCNATLEVSQKIRMGYVRFFKKKEITKCPRCGSENLDTRGIGAYMYGQYEHYEWFCKDCNYCEEHHYYDLMDKERKEKNNAKS